MLINKEKCRFYIPDKRKQLLEEAKVQQKLTSLLSIEDLQNEIIALPDFGDDKEGLNGVYFRTKDTVLPIGPGSDVGCGFRVLHIKKEKVDDEYIERTFKDFAKKVTSNQSGIEMEVEDVEKLFKHPKKWIEERSMVSTVEETMDHKIDETKSVINKRSVARSFARIAKGNHFIELRKVEKITNKTLAKKMNIEKDDLIIHIHSGAGLFVEQEMKNYLSLFYNGIYNRGYMEGGKIDNGYKSFRSVQNQEGKNYLFDAERSMRISYMNRAVLQYMIENWLGKRTNFVFDMPHDKIRKTNKGIEHFKAVQEYSGYRGEKVAILPTTISQNAYFLAKRGELEVVNHGVGDGESGEAKEVKGVKTNFDEPILRKFFDEKEVMNYCENQKWFEVVFELSPWICIKNRGNW